MSTTSDSQLSLFGDKFLGAVARDGTRPTLSRVLESIKKAVDRNDWEMTVAISRRLYANMGIPKGAVNLKAVLAVGNAWDPEYKGSDVEWGKKAKEWLLDSYFPAYNVRGPSFDFKTDLYLDSVGIDRCGDVMTLLTASESGFPMVQNIPNHLIKSPRSQRDGFATTIKLMMPAHLVGGKYGEPAQEREVPVAYIDNGMAYTQYGRPFAFHVYPEGRNGRADLLNGEGKWVHEQYLIHTFDPEWVEQGRGFPAFTHAVRQFISMLTSQEFEEITHMILSSVSLVEHNEEGVSDPVDPTTVITSVQEDGSSAESNLSGATPLTDQLAEDGVSDIVIQKIVGGVVKYFKAGTGSKVEPMAKNTPGDMWEKFQDRLIRVSLAGINMPYSIVWKGNDDNGTSNRVSIEKLHRVTEDRQALLRSPAQRKLLYGLAVAMKTGRLPRTANWYQWDFVMPPEFGIDDGRLSESVRRDYAMGLTTLTRVLGSRGQGEVKSHWDTRAEEAAQKKLAAKRATEKYKADGIEVTADDLGVVGVAGTPLLAEGAGETAPGTGKAPKDKPKKKKPKTD